MLSRLSNFIHYKGEGALINWPADSVSGVRLVIGSEKEDTTFLQVPFNSSSEMWQHPKPCFRHKNYLCKVKLCIEFTILCDL